MWWPGQSGAAAQRERQPRRAGELLACCGSRSPIERAEPGGVLGFRGTKAPPAQGTGQRGRALTVTAGQVDSQLLGLWEAGAGPLRGP